MPKYAQSVKKKITEVFRSLNQWQVFGKNHRLQIKYLENRNFPGGAVFCKSLRIHTNNRNGMNVRNHERPHEHQKSYMINRFRTRPWTYTIQTSVHEQRPSNIDNRMIDRFRNLSVTFIRIHHMNDRNGMNIRKSTYGRRHRLDVHMLHLSDGDGINIKFWTRFDHKFLGSVQQQHNI